MDRFCRIFTGKWCIIVLVIWFGLMSSTVNSSSGIPGYEEVTPYLPGHHGSRRSHREVRECQPVKYGNTTHQMQPSHHWDQPVQYPIVTRKFIFDDFPMGERAPGHIVWANSPGRTVSVLEPFGSGGCTNRHRASVDVSARQEDCLVAVNAGFFNTRTGDCYGNVVSNGRRVQNNGGIQNAHFGIRADGTLVFGYLSEEDVLDEENPFVQLVGGVGWLVRDGEIYVDESRKAECDQVEESGTVDYFFDMLSARVAIGSDKEGRVVIAAIDGQSRVRGLSTSAFASWLRSHGVVNAINLDGGGSATFVINGTIANNPSDHCHEAAYRCPRQVSTIVCVHEPRCKPRDCNKHGDCIQGECRCHDNWHGPSCDQLMCGSHNCSSHGQCIGAGGCRCDSGYLPPDCIRVCPRGWHGVDCRERCQCHNGGSCDPVTGECSCLPGYTGQRCELVCPLGFHGPGCWDRCQCSDELCPCHHITGSCDLPANHTFYGGVLKAAQCLATKLILKEDLTHRKKFLEYELSIALIILVAVATVSVLLNVICLCFRCRCTWSSPSCDYVNGGHFVNGLTSMRKKNDYRQLQNSDYSEEDDL